MRWLIRRLQRPVPIDGDDLVVVGDDVRRGWIVPPVSVVDLEALPAEELADGHYRITFWVNVRDAAGQAGRDLAVDARISGPERTAEGSAPADEHGQVRFRMSGPAGTYRCEVLDVGAGGVEVRRGDDGLMASTEIVVA